MIAGLTLMLSCLAGEGAAKMVPPPPPRADIFPNPSQAPKLPPQFSPKAMPPQHGTGGIFCDVATAKANEGRGMCPIASCMAPPPCQDGSTPKMVDEVDWDMYHYGTCCLKMCNFKCEGGTGKCATFTWPPPGTMQCTTNADCIEGEVCEGCMSSSCKCDEATGKRDEATCTEDCMFTCRGSFEPATAYLQQCSISNGGCSPKEKCVETPMMCFNPPCPNKITCVAPNGDDVLVTYRGHTMQGAKLGVRFAQFHPDSGKVVSVDESGTIQVWGAENGAAMSTGKFGSNFDLVLPSGTPWSADGRRLGWAEHTKPFMCPDCKETSEVHIIPDPSANNNGGWTSPILLTIPDAMVVTSMAWGPERLSGDIMYMSRMAVVLNRGLVWIIDPYRYDAGAVVQPQAECAAPDTTATVNSAHFASDGLHLGIGVSGGRACGFQAQMTSCVSLGECLATGGQADILQALWSPDMTMVAGAGADGKVYVWDLVKGEGALIFTFSGHTAAVNSIAWHPDSKKVASASDDSTVKIWSVDTSIKPANPLQTFDDHTDKVYHVDWANTADMLVSASQDGTAKVWKWTKAWQPPASVAPGVVPPPPACMDALSQLCPNDNNELCQSCVSELGFMLKQSGCTQQDYADYCGNSQSCQAALERAGCDAAGQTASSCFACAAKIQATLPTCDQGLVEATCAALQPRPADCKNALNKVCQGLNGQGPICDACVEDNIRSLQKSGCDYNTTAVFCQGSSGTLTCEAALDKSCSKTFQTGQSCYQCLAANQNTIRQGSCTNSQLQEYCAVPIAPAGGPGTNKACVDLLKQACPDNKDQVGCLRCISPRLNELIDGGCTRNDAINYCQLG